MTVNKRTGGGYFVGPTIGEKRKPVGDLSDRFSRERYGRPFYGNTDQQQRPEGVPGPGDRHISLGTRKSRAWKGRVRCSGRSVSVPPYNYAPPIRPLYFLISSVRLRPSYGGEKWEIKVVRRRYCGVTCPTDRPASRALYKPTGPVAGGPFTSRPVRTECRARTYLFGTSRGKRRRINRTQQVRVAPSASDRK